MINPENIFFTVCLKHYTHNLFIMQRKIRNNLQNETFGGIRYSNLFLFTFTFKYAGLGFSNVL